MTRAPMTSRCLFSPGGVDVQIGLVKTVGFSPTGTTRKILQAISEGVGGAHCEHFDCTLPGNCPERDDANLFIVGAPVYGGRLPKEMLARLAGLRGQETPAVLVVVYGNRAYEDALLELRDWAVAHGFAPVAAAAFVAEHSFSCIEYPIASSRPDQSDLACAVRFGELVRAKLALHGMTEMELSIPGGRPYRDYAVLPRTSPISRQDACSNCGACANVCPTGAISLNPVASTDRDRCLLCFACVRRCRRGARVMIDEKVVTIARRLSASCGERKEPEWLF